MTVDQLKNDVIPAAVEALNLATPGKESEIKSPIRKASLEVCGESFTILEQNTKKLDPQTGELSKFAKLAKAGHHVFWLIREEVLDWFLIVDGKPTKKDRVTSDGQLLADAHF